MSFRLLSIFSLFLSYVLVLGSAEQCGWQNGGALCPGGLCCSAHGWCGNTDEYCTPERGCQSQCGGGGTGWDELADLITEETFDLMLSHRNDGDCPAHGFYTYEAFLEAAEAFPLFARSGDEDTRKREVAAFLAQTSFETSGWETWVKIPHDPYTWGYCYVEVNPSTNSSYCQWSPIYPCAPGKSYYGRGPIQLSWNYNYGRSGDALGLDLLNNPDLVSDEPLISFETAFWFWMTPQLPIMPSAHDVMAGAWTPSAADLAAGRLPGYGLVTNIISGGLECGQAWNATVDRIGFYKRYCDLLGVSYGDNLDCYSMSPFGNELSVNSM